MTIKRNDSLNIDLLNINEENNIEDMYLTFNVRNEEYAVNISYVTEIVGMQKISEVPDVPEFIKGVINLRGKVIPLMDVRLRFGLPWQDYNDRTTIIVLEVDNVSTGLVVDQVNEVLEISKENIDPPPRWHGTSEQSIISALGKREDSVCIILDVIRLLSDEKIRIELPEDIMATISQE